MLDWLKREYAQLITSGAQLLLLFVGIRLHSRNGWLYCLAAIALISLYAWLSSLYRLRTLRNTPTSKIASAAQGYVELMGSGQPFCDPPLLSNLRRHPCLWCRYKIEQRERNGWRTLDSGETSDSFILRDDTGECVVDPESAEIITQDYDQWQMEGCRYTECKLIKGETLYVIGQFRTQGGSNQEFDTRAELSALLTEWKKNNMSMLLTRFDLNKDGELSIEEWELARQAAKREVEKMKVDVLAQPSTNVISRSPDGQLFLISNLSQDRLSRRYLLWAWGHLMIFFGSLGGLGWVRVIT
ncbi:MAG: GIDE domain-containing protein [Candidatus Nitrotoga sp.]|nr:GIDE domain-containing protein [Candidatus Nitrotoga sp.]